MKHDYIRPVAGPGFPYWRIPGLFLAVMAAGAGLLHLPISHRPGQSLSWLDAAFLSVSAVSVTGLAPVDTAQVLSRFGEMVLLFLVQMGGIGIVTSGTLFMLLRGQRLSLADERYLQATLGHQRKTRPVQVFVFTTLFVLLCELAGAALLFPLMWRADPTKSPAILLWEALFHSINGFCNAGFSDEASGAARWRQHPPVLGVLSLLVILGSIGMPTLLNLRSYRPWRRLPEARGQLTLQTRLALSVSIALLLAGTASILVLERKNTLADLPATGQVAVAWFQSAMLRTGGFTAVDLGQMEGATLMISILLMFIGGSPGSMAGGIKTTTVALLAGVVGAAWMRRQDVVVLGRRISPETRSAALMVALLGGTVVATGLLGLMITEADGPASQTGHRWLALLFEGVSAFCTVGLTTGVTPLLSPAGKVWVMALMYLGRVGTLMLAFRLATPVHPRRIRQPEEEVSLG